MLHKVSLEAANIDKYRLIECRGFIDEVVNLGEGLKTVFVAHQPHPLG